MRRILFCLLIICSGHLTPASARPMLPAMATWNSTVPVFNNNQEIFRAGAALRIITPNPLLPVSGGIGQPNPVHEKQGDLFVRALVLEKGSLRVAIVSIDNLGWTAILGDRSRQLVKGILPENILIGATHTHSAPDAYAFPDENGKTGADMPYLDWCVHQVADAINEALSKLQAATLKSVVAKVNGRIAYNYYAEDLYDPRCGVMQFIDREKGNTIATLVNYAVHPEVIGPSRGILSPDLCGPLYERIESKTGGVAIFMNSAQGGMVTADNRAEGGKERNDYDECRRIGNLLADESLRILADAPDQKNPELFCASARIAFPVSSPIMKYILNNSPLKSTQTKGDTIYTRLNLLNIGRAQLLTIPGEALPNIGFYVKRHMHTDQPFLFGLTNDAFGYMLTKVDFMSFSKYDYVSRTSLGEMTGEIYMEEALKLINRCPPASGK